MDSHKDIVRRQAIARRRALAAEDRQRAARGIARRVLRSRDFARARRVGLYLALPDEVDTALIVASAWRTGKTVCLPRITQQGHMTFAAVRRDSTLRRNALGIWEPLPGRDVAPTSLDLVFVPLAAFDAAKQRIGMGGGYYDRYFAFAASRHRSLPPRLIGLAFSVQRVDAIDTQSWDVGLARIVTEAS